MTLQAQNYAASKASLYRLKNYDDLTSQSKAAILNSNGFYDEVSISAESAYTADPKIKEKECTIRVYKDDEVFPRSMVKFMRYSVESNSGVPKGSVIPWYGSLDDIPNGFALCNGQNGTPDLRDRFIVGAGSSYVLGNIGGASSVILSYAQMPSHAHNRGSMNITGFIAAGWLSGSGAFYAGGYVGASGDGHGHPSSDSCYFDASRSWTGVTSYEGGNQAHENRPPYYALYYIMKL